MINVSETQTDNTRLVGRLLPWWLRGRFVVRFLSAIAYPLVLLHLAWQKWALDRVVEASVTSQRRSLVWYLNYKLRRRFRDAQDSFALGKGMAGMDCYVFNASEWRKAMEFSQPVVFLAKGREWTIDAYNADEDRGAAFDRARLLSFSSGQMSGAARAFAYSDCNDIDDTMTVWRDGERYVGSDCIIIYAPLMRDFGRRYTLEMYRAEIMSLARRYVTNFQNIIIVYDERVFD